LQQTLTDLDTALPLCGIKEETFDLGPIIDPIISTDPLGTCIADVQNLVTLAQKLMADVTAKDISSLINDATAFINLIQQAIKDCQIAE